MSRRAWFVLTVALVLASVMAPRVRAADEPDVSGTYTCVGDNAAGGQYKGTVTIKKEGDAYNLTWVIGDDTHAGLGIVQGNTLSSCWLVKTPTGATGGIVVYTIKKNKLEGKWTEFGTEGRVLTETLTKSR